MQPTIHKIFGVLGLVAMLACSPQEASATCGERGGPGYRGPNGQCVGWASIGKICGDPPTTRCLPEMANPNAPDAAKHGKAIEALRPVGAVVPMLSSPPSDGAVADAVAHCKTIADSTARLACFDGLASAKK
jgi:hypothetical protein